MANGMGSLYVGVSGLQSANNAINTTSHNITNVNTTGYTRQQVVFNDSIYQNIGQNAVNKLQSGIGVDVQEVRRCRDEFLDNAYRQELGRKGFYESQYEVYTEIETQFGEMQGVKFQEIIDNLKGAVNELALNPTSNVARSALVQNAVAFIDRANEIHNSLKRYQSTLNTKIKNMVDRVNELGTKIRDYNLEIAKIEAGEEHANDIRDARDAALDELGGLVKIKYNEDAKGAIEIQVENTPFLVADNVLEMETKTIPGTDLVVPVWPFLEDKEVFALNVDISTDKNNDVGELKGILLARGGELPDYTALDDEEYYKNNIAPSAIMKTVATFDNLIHHIVTDINDVLCPEKDGKLDMDATSYGMDENRSVGVELFSRNYTDRYIKTRNAEGEIEYVRNDTNYFGLESLYTLENISVNPAVLENYARIPLTNKNGEESFDKAEQLLDLWKKQDMVLNPLTGNKETYSSYYNSMIYDIANTGQVMGNMASSEDAMSISLDNRRKEVAGVSSDEELTNLIKFQNAYNASSRYITVVSEMLEHLIERLGA